MGWWSTDIMGGDTPLDYKDEIFEICGVEQFPDEGPTGELTKEHFAKHLDKIINDVITPAVNNDYYDRFAIACQVLGVLMMKCGADIDEDLKKRIIIGSKTDSWANEDDDRRISVDGFNKAIEAYDGTPIEIKSKGLFQVIAEKGGLANEQ